MFCTVVQSVGFADLLLTLVLEEEMEKNCSIRAGSKQGFSDNRHLSPALSLGFRPPAIQTARNQCPSL